jgi:long-chain acyl-CoA synthetase
MNLTDIFYETVERQPDHPAIIGPKDIEDCTYKQLKDEIEAVALRLREAGVRPGQCIGLRYPSGKEYIILNYAIWRCNAIVVPIAMELVPDETVRVCKDIVMDAIISQKAAVKIFISLEPDSPRAVSDNVVIFHIKKFREHPAGFFDINTAFLRFSSGTTGTSKGVVLSHETVYERIHAANEILEIGPDDRIIWLLSMAYHFTVSIVSYLSFGATIILCKNHFGATIIDATHRVSGTIIYGSPMQYELMVSAQNDKMLDSLRLAISTTISLKQRTAEAFIARFKKPLTQAYGIIEIGLPFINLNSPTDKLSSVGKLLPSYEIFLEDIGLGSQLRAIKLKGKGFFNAYYNPWQTRDQVMQDGWFATGDLGELDGDGYLFIKGRSKEIINVAGMKIFPQEVDAVLESHPAVTEACVFAHTSDKFGEVPYAHVIANSKIDRLPTENELKSYCSPYLSAYKIPEKISFVEKLERTASGKLIRDEKRLISRSSSHGNTEKGA